MDSHPKKTRSRPMLRSSRPATGGVKRINLALQGGGAHGPFTWGVLDRLLDEPRIEIEGVSATSSGAMNAVAMAHGHTIGGREGAREALENFWHRVAQVAALFSPVQGSPAERQVRNHGLENPAAHLFFETVSRFLSPYQLNPFNYNPLRRLIGQVVDFERLRQGSAIKMFLSATNVRTGKVKVFTDKEITAD